MPLRRLCVGIAVGLLTLMIIAQLLLPNRLRRRLESGIAGAEMSGRLGDVSVCVPCGSYRIRDVELRSNRDDEPLFAARVIDVGLDFSNLAHLRWAGRIQLHDATVEFSVGHEDGGLATDWAGIGASLFPAPVASVSARGGHVIVSNRSLDPPVVWHFTNVRLRGDHLSRRRDGLLRTKAVALGEGKLEAKIEFTGPTANAFRLDARITDVPLVALNDYLDHALHLDVEEGRLSVFVALSRSDTGRLEGRIDYRVHDVDVVELGELGEGRPLRTAWESVVAASIWSSSDESRVFELTSELSEDTPTLGVDAWDALGTVLSRSIIRLLASPLTTLRWIVEHSAPS